MSSSCEEVGDVETRTVVSITVEKRGEGDQPGPRFRELSNGSTCKRLTIPEREGYRLGL